MPIPELPLEGGCRCGRVRFRINQQPMMETICHCHGCQRMSASAFSTTLIMPEAGFAFIAGETVIGGMHSGEGDLAQHHSQRVKQRLQAQRLRQSAAVRPSETASANPQPRKRRLAAA